MSPLPAACGAPAFGELRTVEEVSAQLRVTPATLRGWLRDGRLEGIPSGGRWLIPSSAVETYLAVCRDGHQQRIEARRRAEAAMVEHEAAEAAARNTRKAQAIEEAKRAEIARQGLESLRDLGVRCLG